MVRGSIGPQGLAVEGGGERARLGGVVCAVGGRPATSRPATRAPAATTIVAGYAARGAEVLDDLHGSFVLALWDEERGEGLLAVDPLGTRAVVYREGTGGELRFAEEMRDLLQALRTTPGPAPRALARWLAQGMLEPGETLYDGIRRLPGGHYLHYARGSWQCRRYWAPTYVAPQAVEPEEAVAAVRREAERAVAERTESGGLAVLLSGGIDSSSVAALARTVGVAGGELPAYSATFPDHPEADESALTASTAASLGLRWQGLPAAAVGVLAAAAGHVADWRLPPVSPTLFFQLPVLEAAAADGAKVVLDGQGGDELFGCAPYLVGDELRGLRLRGAWRLASALAGPAAERRVVRRALRIYGVGGRRRPRPGVGLLRPEVAGLLDPPPAPWERLDGPRWWAARADELTTGRERFGAHDHLRRKFASAGLVGAHPFFDDLGLVELMLRLPPQLSFDPVYDRPLLRAAVAGLVPDAVRLRIDKSYFDAPLVASLQGPDRRTVAALLTRPEAEIRAYVLPNASAAFGEPPRTGRAASAWAWRTWRLASTALWLESLAQ